MDLTPYVDGLRRDLTATAGAAGEEARAAAERLLVALDPAVRLALMEAVSQAAAEITSELPAGTVDVRLAGRELEFAVHVDGPLAPPQPPPPPTAPQPPGHDTDEEGAVARVSLRLPEAVKARAEELADQAGQSLNTWLVGVVRDATRTSAVRVDVDLSSIPFFGRDPFADTKRGGHRMTGWV